MRLVKSRGSTAANNLDRPNSLVSVFRFLDPGRDFILFPVCCTQRREARFEILRRRAAVTTWIYF